MCAVLNLAQLRPSLFVKNIAGIIFHKTTYIFTDKKFPSSSSGVTSDLITLRDQVLRLQMVALHVPHLELHQPHGLHHLQPPSTLLQPYPEGYKAKPETKRQVEHQQCFRRDSITAPTTPYTHLTSSYSSPMASTTLTGPSLTSPTRGFSFLFTTSRSPSWKFMSQTALGMQAGTLT